MDGPRPTRSRAYVPVAPKNHEGDVEARNTTANEIHTNGVCSNGTRTGNNRRPYILRNTGP